MANGINPFTRRSGDILEETEDERRERERLEREAEERKRMEEWDVREPMDYDLDAREVDRLIHDPYTEMIRGGTMRGKLSKPISPRGAALPPDEIGDRLPSWDEKPKGGLDRESAWEAKAKKRATQASIRAQAKLAKLEKLLVAARKKYPKPGGLERGLAMVTGGISGAATGMFDRKRAAAQAEKDVRETFETEWERGQDWGTEKSRQKLQSELIQARARATSDRTSAEKAVTAMAMTGLTEIQPWVLRNFKKPSDIEFVEDAFRSAVLDFNAIGTKHERQKAQVANMDHLGALGYFHTWDNEAPTAIIPSWQPTVDLAFKNSRAGQEVTMLEAGGKRKDIRTEVQQRFAPILLPVFERVYRRKSDTEPNSDWHKLFNPVIEGIATETAGRDEVKKIENIQGLQLLAISALGSSLVSPQQKEDLKNFMGIKGVDPDTGKQLPWQPTDAFTNLETLESRLKAVGFDADSLDQMQRNMERIARLRDELEKTKKDFPPVGGERSKEVTKGAEKLAMATALTFSNWKMRKVEGPDGEITYDSVETKPKPYTIMTFEYKGGIGISYIISPEFRKNASPTELADMKADANAEVKRFVEEGDHIEWVPELGPQGGDKFDSGAKARAEAHIASLTPLQLKATTDAMERYKKVGKSGLTREELNLIFDLQPLLEAPNK